MNKDVLYSLLALDAYNRGYGQNVVGADTDIIGDARFIRQSNTNQGSDEVDAGFYASAYNWNGETIISYRGTNFDFNTANPFESPAFRESQKKRFATTAV